MKNQRGMTLVEVVIAIAVLGIIAAGFLAALGGSSKAVIKADQRTTAENLARSQWEYVKSQPYDDDFDYDVIDPGSLSYASSHYAINKNIPPDPDQTVNEGLQEMTYVVYYDGKEVLRLTGYKLKR